MIEEEYIEKFYKILIDNYENKPLLYQKATSYINGIIKNGGKVNELVYSGYKNRKHFHQNRPIFCYEFVQNNVFIEANLFKFMEEKGMIVVAHKFLYLFHHNIEILSHINEKYIQAPLSQEDKDGFYEAFMASVKFGNTETLPFYFNSSASKFLLENEEQLINSLSYYLYWNSYDDKNEEAIATVLCKIYEKKQKNLFPNLNEAFLKIIYEKQKENLDEYGNNAINKVKVIVDNHILNLTIQEYAKQNKEKKQLKI